jgi:hypothetical protein
MSSELDVDFSDATARDFDIGQYMGIMSVYSIA